MAFSLALCRDATRHATPAQALIGGPGVAGFFWFTCWTVTRKMCAGGEGGQSYFPLCEGRSLDPPLSIEVSRFPIEDPKVLTRSWVVPKVTLQLAPFDQIMEVMCSGVETAPLMDAAAKDNYGRK